jgi:hypothetical protein
MLNGPLPNQTTPATIPQCGGEAYKTSRAQRPFLALSVASLPSFQLNQIKMKYALGAALVLQSSLALGELLPVHFKAPTTAHFRDIVRNDTYDFGCRPVAHPTEDGHFTLHALLTEDQIAHLTKEYESVDEITIHRQMVKRAATAPIGSGDRFSSGTVSPVGLGTQASGTTISSIMSVKEITSAFNALVKNYGVGSVTLPYKTFNGATSYAGFVGAGTDKSAYRLYLSAAMHARERGGPDNLLYWISDLLAANKAGTGLTYGKKTYTNAQVKSVLAAGIVFFPLVNPDGVAYDQSSGSLWRKNRNTKSGSSGSSIGVDLNRNFDFLWNFRKYFDSGEAPASTSPSSETFYGTAAASEPETKNHVSIYDSFPKVIKSPPALSALLTLYRSDGSWIFTPPLATSCTHGEMTMTRPQPRQ